MSKLQNNFEINRAAQRILTQVEGMGEGFPWMSVYLDTSGGENRTEKLRYFLNQKKAELKRSAWFKKKFVVIKRAWKMLTVQIKKASSQDGSLLFYYYPEGDYLASVYLPLRPLKNYMTIDDRPSYEPLVDLLERTRASLCLVLEPEQAMVYSLFLNQAPNGWKLCPEGIDEEETRMWVLRRYKRMGAISGANHLRHLALITDHLLKQYLHEKVFILGDEGYGEKLAEMIPSQFRSLVELKKVSWCRNDKGNGELEHVGGGKVGDGEVEELKRQLMVDSLAVRGVGEVMEAMRKGQIRELLVEEELPVVGWECPVCASIGYGESKKCLYCQSPVETVDCIKEMVVGRMRRYGGKVVELPQGELPKACGGVAAFLRYPAVSKGNGGGGVFV